MCVCVCVCEKKRAFEIRLHQSTNLFTFLWCSAIIETCHYIYIYIYHRHHHVLLAWISLTLSHHLSLLSITFGRSSMLHPVSVQSCCRLVLASPPTLARLCEGVHRSTLLMSFSLLLQLYLTWLVCLIWTVFERCGRWSYIYEDH